MNLENLTIEKISTLLREKKISCSELTLYYLENIEKHKDKNAVLEVFDDALDRAKELDKMLDNDSDLPGLFGVPILIKDNILYKGKICSNASKSMQNYVAQYNATVIDRLLDAGVIILGRTNMDEFAMGGSCENSAFGPCKNAHDDSRVSGGSSGGSAVAVALNMCAFALGSDTGGSVRQPASFNGIVGLKPTYGRVSRYGLCAYASSLDTIGVLTRTVEDNAKVLSVIAGYDIHDNTTPKIDAYDYLMKIKHSIEGKKIAIIKEVQELVDQTENKGAISDVINFCKANGAVIHECSIPEYKSVLSAYYTIAPAEASSNMGRLDAVRFGKCENNENLEDLYTKFRSENLGKEVKRRIMLGNFVLSSERYNDYYVKAKNIAYMLRKKVEDILKDNDLIFMPTTYGEAFPIGEKISDPVSMYIEDMFTVFANITGLPAISIPVAKSKTNLPLGLQILSSPMHEGEIYNMADFIMKRGGKNNE